MTESESLVNNESREINYVIGDIKLNYRTISGALKCQYSAGYQALAIARTSASSSLSLSSSFTMQCAPTEFGLANAA